MVGLLFVSHGKTAEGWLDSLTMFFGENIEAVDTLTLTLEDSAEEFGERIHEKIAQLDQGEGVIVLADLRGGTPANQASMYISDKVKVVYGVNLPLCIELLSVRDNGEEIDLEEIVLRSQQAILTSNTLFSDTVQEKNEDEL